MNENIFATYNFDALMAFAVVARERNIRKAAQVLNISQPPLSRKIQRLEAQLGLTLFERNSTGVELTDDGEKVLTIIKPLLELANEASEKLTCLTHTNSKNLSIGLTTAFEQTIFEPYLKLWESYFGDCCKIVRKESPNLIKDVLKRRLTAAFVAFPVEAYDLLKLEIGYSEKLFALIPTSWKESAYDSLSLAQLNEKPMFWFQRKRNQAYFDYMDAIFAKYKFKPVFIDEPDEYDVLMARISFGEGWALLPESFSKLKRESVKFVPIEIDNGISLSILWDIYVRKKDLY